MIYKLKLHGRTYNVSIDYTGRYPNGRQAIELIDAKNGESVLVATVNIPEIALLKNEIAIKDYSENEGVLQFLMDAKIVSAPLRVVSSGFVLVPIVKLLANPMYTVKDNMGNWVTVCSEVYEGLKESFEKGFFFAYVKNIYAEQTTTHCIILTENFS